jgi:hypothetical protein
MNKPFVLMALCASLTLYGFSQDIIKQFNFTKPDVFQVYLDNQPTFCNFKNGAWANTQARVPKYDGANKLTIVHFGSFDNLSSQHNLNVLAQLQASFPELNIFLVNNPKFDFPKYADEVERMMAMLDNPLPVYLDEGFEVWNCNQVDTWPTTLFLAPDGKIIDRTNSLLNYRSLELKIPLVLRMLRVIKPTNTQPFATLKPSLRGKNQLLKYPIAIEKNEAEFILFVSDFSANRIWVMSNMGDVLDVIGSGEKGDEDGDWTAATFDGPWGLAWDKDNNALYVADHYNHRVRKVDFSTKQVSTILGSGLMGDKDAEKGVGTSFNMAYPTQLEIQDYKLFIALGVDAGIWQCDLRTEVAERIAGTGHAGFKDGNAKESALAQPMGMAMDKTGVLFFSDAQASAIRAVDDGVLSTKAGSGLFDYGMSNDRKAGISFQYPMGMCVYNDDLYIADSYNHCIRKFDPFKKRSETMAGSGVPGYKNGSGGEALYHYPTDLVVLEGKCYITDAGNGLIRTYDLQTNRSESLRLFNYDKIARGNTPIITDLRELEGVEIASGNNLIDLEIDLGERYELDPSGYSNFAVSSRNDTLFVRKDAMRNEGKILLDYQLEPDINPEAIVLDFYLYFREKARPEMQYFRGVSYIIPTKLKDGKPEGMAMQLLFDPDAIMGIVPAQSEQLFME